MVLPHISRAEDGIQGGGDRAHNRAHGAHSITREACNGAHKARSGAHGAPRVRGAPRASGGAYLSTYSL